MKPARFVAIVLALLASRVSGEALAGARPDLKKLGAALTGADLEAWSAAARELAACRPHPLNDGWFVAHPTHSGGRIPGGAEVRSALEGALASKDPKRRVLAVDALVGLSATGVGRPTPYYALKQALRLKKEASPTPDMIKLANDPEPRVRAGVLWLWRLDDNRSARPLALKLLRDPAPAVRAQAILVLARFGTSDQAIDSICEALRDEDPQVRIAALHAVVAFRAERAAERVLALLQDKDPAVRHAAAMAVGWLELGDGADRLHQLLDDKGEGVVIWYSMVIPGSSSWRTHEGTRSAATVAGAAMWALGQLGDVRVVPRLLKELRVQAKGKRESDGTVSWYAYPKDWYAPTAAYALGRIGDPRALGPLNQALARGDVAHRARGALSAMELSLYEAIPYRPLSYPRHVLEWRRRPDGLCEYPRQFIPHLYGYKGLAPEEFLRQVFVPRKDYPKDHPLSLVADFPRVRVGALECLGRYIDSPKLRGLLVKLAAEKDPTLRWGAAYVLARAGDPRAKALAREIPKEPADARLLAALALCELGDERAVPVLREHLDAREVSWQLLLAQALVRLGDSQGVRKLAALAEGTEKARPHAAAAHALAQDGGDDAVYVLESWAQRNNWGESALEGLSRLAHQGKLSRDRLVQAVRARIRDRYAPVVCAEHRLWELRAELLDYLADHYRMAPRFHGHSINVPWALAAIGDYAVLTRALELVKDEHAEVRGAAATTLGDMRAKPIAPTLIALTKDRVPAVRIAAARALGCWRPSGGADQRLDVLAALRKMDEDPNLSVRLEAAAARAKLGDPSAKPPLEAIVTEGPNRRRFIAQAALAALGQKNHLSALRDALMTELRRVDLRNCPRAYELIRLLGWCGAAESLELLEKIPSLPCADAEPYDGGAQRRSLLAAASLARWRIRRGQRQH